jgi:hypothetical protein
MDAVKKKHQLVVIPGLSRRGAMLRGLLLGRRGGLHRLRSHVASLSSLSLITSGMRRILAGLFSFFFFLNK